MKKAIAAALLGLALSAHASGPYDGIYQSDTGAEAWMSVQTNGNAAVATYYFVVPASGIYYSSSVGTIYPTQVNLWDLLLGSWTGNVLNVSGQMNYGACAMSITAVFSPSTATATINSSANTFVGNRSGVNCGALNRAQLRFNKIF